MILFCTSCALPEQGQEAGDASATQSPTICATPDATIAQPTVTPEATIAPTPAPTEDLSMYAVNPITGLQNMRKENVGMRPFAIMISNIKKATPQVGITTCDMYYEVEAEGGITRILGIYADVATIPNMLGPVRSAREYYVDIALGYNAIFAHYGTSTTAENKIKKYGVDNLDGMYLSKQFWRDEARKEKYGSVHSVVTSSAMVADAIAKKKYETDGAVGNYFSFYPKDQFTVDGTLQGAQVAAQFSGSTTAKFTYNEQDKLYYKSQFNAPHVDDKGQQIAVTNVIVLYTNIKVVDGEGHLSVDLSNGRGYYFSGGKGKEITWSKGSPTEPMRYYNVDGSDLKVNAGKTYVCIVRRGEAVTNQ